MNDYEKQSLILIRRGKCHTRAELARHLGISRPTASIIVEQLLAQHALKESGILKSPRGKMPTLLKPVPEYLYTIGMDLGYSNQIAGVLLDNTGKLIKSQEEECDCYSLTSIKQGTTRLINKLSGNLPIAGIGLALAAILDPSQERVIRSINPLLEQNDIAQLLSSWSKLPVCCENRSNLAAFSEAFAGAANDEDNFALLSLGKSIGAAFWFNGELFRGSHFSAGEIRLMRLSDGSILENALSNQAETHIALTACYEAIEQLNAILDIDQYVLAGRFSDFSSDFVETLNQHVQNKLNCSVRLSHFGRFSAARGAALKCAEDWINRQ